MQCKTRPTFEPSYSLSTALMERPSEFQFLMELFREAFLESPLGRLLRAPAQVLNPVANIEYPPAEEIISRSVRNHRQPIPPGFGAMFLKLPKLLWTTIAGKLPAIDVRNLRIAAARFDNLIMSERTAYPMMPLHRGRIVLIGTERVKVYRNRSIIEINHAQLLASLRTIDNNVLMLIRQEGRLEAASFHIPNLTCKTIQIQIVDPLSSEEEDELAEILEQINRNAAIDLGIGVLVRSENNREALRERLLEITSRNRRVPQDDIRICVVPP